MISPPKSARSLQRLLKRSQRLARLHPRTFCLIAGAPRSGTTAVCNWLTGQVRVIGTPETRILVAAHRFVQEIDRFKRLSRQEGFLLSRVRRCVEDFYAQNFLLWNKVLVDKQPGGTITFPEGDYLEFIRNVRRLFPETKLIFMVRGPLETIWSMSRRKWGQSFSSGDLRTIPLEAHVQNWNACMEVVAAYQADPNVYVSSFEKLITEPAAESARIRDFLGLGPGPAFTPRETKTPGFSADEQAQILEQTAAAWSAVFTGTFNGSPQTDTVAVAQGRSAAE